MMQALLVCLIGATAPVVLSEDATVTASSHAGGKYAPEKAVDGSAGTRWATADRAALPQWFEVRFGEPSKVDLVLLTIAVDHLYSNWQEVEVTFSEGDAVRETLPPNQTVAAIRFEPRTTEWVRVSVLSVYEARHYVGLYELLVAFDPDGKLGEGLLAATPLSAGEIMVRDQSDHPCVNVTPEDVVRARERIERYHWAKKERDAILEEADTWLRETDAYWLQFLPEPGACYAYGRTNCPICGGRFGTWYGANCSWEKPWKATCSNGHVLPNEEYPDDGSGYTGADGRIHYPIGVWNAWVTERWTQFALPSLSQAYLLTGDERYAERGSMFLDALASIYRESTSGSWDYPSNPPSGRLCRPWYQVARTLVLYVDHYDFQYHSPSMDKPSLRKPEDGEEQLTRRENIEQNLLLDGAYYCYSHSFSGGLHNGHADYMRGALAVGCALDVPAYVENSLKSPFSVHTMIANNLDRDGRYYETSLGYAFHARNLYLTFADPLHNLRSEEYPEGVKLYDDPKFRTALLLPDLQAMLAGRMPNFGDMAPDVSYRPSPERPYSNYDYRFLERLYARTSDPAEQEALGQSLQWLAQGDLDALRENAHDRNWLLWHGADPSAGEGTPSGDSVLSPDLDERVNGSWVAGMKGLVFLRGGDQAALLRYGPSLTHGDPDDLGLLYYANGYNLSYDIGYGFGSTHAHVGWASQTVSHCLVTVDEVSQFKAPGTSGGSLQFFADLPSVKVVEAESKRSYTSQGVSEYRRTVALVGDGGYLFDVFRVEGGRQHDYGWGSIGTDLEPFGVVEWVAQEGSLAEGVAWGQRIVPEGDIEGYPEKPYWNPPPGNGYGFFYNVRRGHAEGTWGGRWSIDGAVPTEFRMHVVGDEAEAICADAPGLYPNKPNASYMLARRKSDTDAPLRSTFMAVYEPFKTGEIRYDFDNLYLSRNVAEYSVEPQVIDSIGILFLRAGAAGDSVTCRLAVREGTPSPLQVYCFKSPLYGTVQVEWDGVPVGAPFDLSDPMVSGPAPFSVGDVDTTPGEHTITFRMVEADAYYLGVAGLAFGAPELGAVEPLLDEVRRIGRTAAEVHRADGRVDVLIAGSCEGDSAYGPVAFQGDFAYLSGDGKSVRTVEVAGCSELVVGGSALDSGPPAFEATVVDVDLKGRSVLLDKPVPDGLLNRVAVFSNPVYALTTAYHVARVDGKRVYLRASTLALGRGRVKLTQGAHTVVCDVPHMYLGSRGTGFVDGKRLRAASGAETRISRTEPGPPLRLEVKNAAVLKRGEAFDYIDLSPGDTVRIALLRALDPTN